jgi:predicted esterase
MKSNIRKIARGLLALGAPFLAFVAFADPPKGGLQDDVVFTGTSPLSGNSELVRRLLSPLAAAHIRQELTRSGKTLGEQSIDPSQEKFVLYVPPQAPLRGYALLVFVPPWQEAKLPQGWETVLDQYGVVFVSASRSGNDENDLARREPLALIAEQNIARRYPIDPERVYIGGFSGGSHVAMRLALGYPDIFRGAMLNAGSDPIGTGRPPLPPRDLFQQFQNSTRLVYLTGDEDVARLGMDADSVQSMRKWCVFDVDAETVPAAGHDAASPAALARALRALFNPEAPDPATLAACRADIERDLTAQLQQAESLIAGGKRDDAKKLLIDIDARFGGLAAPRSVDLAARLD